MLVRVSGQGLRAGGGIGDVMAFQVDSVPTYVSRLVFDLTFFVIVTVILMNVIFGTLLECALCACVCTRGFLLHLILRTGVYL